VGRRFFFSLGGGGRRRTKVTPGIGVGDREERGWGEWDSKELFLQLLRKGGARVREVRSTTPEGGKKREA